jgi:hypothetical protein
MKRMTLAEISDECVVGAASVAMLPGGQAVSLFYLRAGYTPNDYPSEKEWTARSVIESSSAAKCPTVSVQLAGQLFYLGGRIYRTQVGTCSYYETFK